MFHSVFKNLLFYARKKRTKKNLKKIIWGNRACKIGGGVKNFFIFFEFSEYFEINYF